MEKQQIVIECQEHPEVERIETEALIILNACFQAQQGALQPGRSIGQYRLAEASL